MISCNLRSIGLTRARLTVLLPSLILCYLIFSSSSPSSYSSLSSYPSDDLDTGLSEDPNALPLSNRTNNVNRNGKDGEEKAWKPPPPPAPRYCKGNECMRGRWVRRDPPFKTLEDFQEVYAKRGGSRWETCAVGELPLSAFTRDPKDKDTKVDTLPAPQKRKYESQRLVDVFNWVWQPEGGRKQVEWDAVDLVVRLLRMPGGIVLMGDSVSAGHEHAFHSILEEAGMQFQMFSPPDDYWVIPNQPIEPGLQPPIRSHILDPTHPLTLELQKRAGVPDSRMRRPVFSIIEEHLVVHQEELRRLVAPYGAEPNWFWALSQMRAASRWVDFLAHLSDPYTGLSESGREPKRKEREEGVEWDTVLVFNTGAHWSRGTMYMIPEVGDLEEQKETLASLYRDVIKSVTTKLSTPAFSHLTVLYRSTSPAHPSCHLHTHPSPSLAAARADLHGARFLSLVDATSKDDFDKKVRRRWDWDSFEAHNKAWEEMVGVLQARRAREERRERMERARDEAVEGLVGDARVRGRLRRPGVPGGREGEGGGEGGDVEGWAGRRGAKKVKGVQKEREYRRSVEPEEGEGEKGSEKEEEEGEELERRAPAEYRAGARLGPKWRYVDFWEMSLQRPDAHAAPGRDCLHWCMPAVYNEWTRHIYHLLWTEMEGAGGR